MKCPHCQTAFFAQEQEIHLGDDADGIWTLTVQSCPTCLRLVVEVIGKEKMSLPGQKQPYPGRQIARYLARPRAVMRARPPKEVPAEFAEDYVEAAAVLFESPKASAALSRRCLQHVLREKAGVKKSDLAKEIDEVLSSGSLPSHLAEAIDAVRQIGNFSAHPTKVANTGSVMPVEPGEAEWTLDVLDGLFDFYFVQPEMLQARRATLNAKLASANKPPMK